MRYLIPISLVTIAATALFDYQSVRSQSPFVAQVGGTQLDSGGLARMQTVTARVRELNPRYAGLTADTWVRDQILFREAQRRGLACSLAQAAEQLQSTYQQTVADGQPEALLIAAEASGLAPESYSQTPEAQRTPDTASVIQRYLSDPNVIRTQQAVCSISNLGSEVNSSKINGFATIEAMATDVVVLATDTPFPLTPAATATATP